jgi:hypothetical protein
MNEHTQNVIARIVVGAVGISLVVAVVIATSAVFVVYGVPMTQLDATKALPGEEAHDPAWPNYLLRQREMDFAALTAKTGSLLELFFTQRWWGRFPFLIVTRPIGVMAATFDNVLLAVFFIVQLAVTFVGENLYGLSVAGLRLVDGLYSKARHSETSCPSCFRLMDRPAYKCPSCGELHRDIRPDLRGSFFRSCTCGKRLPTGVLRATWRLDGACQYCGAEVHRGAGVLQDVRVPVFGEPHAGKTRLIFAGLHHILARAGAQSLPVDFPDKSSKERAESGLSQIVTDQRTIKTEWRLDPALTCQIGSGTRGALLHAFDAAGERFQGEDGHDDLRYLDDGHTLFFVVDPFAVPGVREVVASQPRNALIDEHLHPSARNPGDSYGEVISRVQASGTDTKKQRLAVVVTKADVLGMVGVTAPTEDAAIQKWLYDNGLHNVTLAAAREFREVRYFAVASVDGRQSTDDYSAAAPFLWALSTRGFHGFGVPDPRPKAEASA